MFTSYIYQRADWPAFTWDDAELAAPLAEVSYQQGLLLGRMEGMGFDLRTEASVAALTDEVVTSSAIEGEVLNRAEVRSSVASRLGLDVSGLQKSSRDVDGLVEMMLDATQQFQTPLTRERLFGWHVALFPTGRSGLRRITAGTWRTADLGPMEVVSGPMGRERVHFEAPAAEQLELEMVRFLAWFNNPQHIDPLLKAAIAHLWFVTIHPFEDGNGRIARAIADMALAQADGTKDRFYSMSAQISAERKEYYLMLEIAQRGGMDITAWLLWFLGCLNRALLSAEQVLATVMHKARVWDQANKQPLNERQRQIINRLMNGFKGHLTSSKYAKLAKCSADTALRDIKELLELGILVQNPGGGRSTSYRLAEPS